MYKVNYQVVPVHRL